MIPDGPLQVQQQAGSLCAEREKCEAQRSKRGTAGRDESVQQMEGKQNEEG